ncbi:roadblock/LC7 domain-containing protein [Streptantibioticus cattleyicolor]|uniref:Roadblock/LAMTOR2 domain-containing protein n=1 Tax=Streptantibioticus cattleyicolor (strain ATCC 35852 / DSM 46488 / JCM 4925 / NBRC 14057 / NRRL 8057) TaxID=1003195 RepID=F8JJ35_STREN|nr:roadblock/LC7 domain-containing protein [Streptantibioticus cattleyicolor]AEW98872.1 hypothetical protein SCATT_p06790 [Streptantibioticus cattleyicolor NRRL 8057 = DSM 46488]CCB72081.1 conserved protein of unknown function [Streptantibioticus cattleyicolor NRRL 8057 = DSM 46488]
MAARPDVHDELRRLRARLPGLTGSLAASSDGLLIAHDTTAPAEAESLAALTAVALEVGRRLTGTTGAGAFRELLVHGTEGYAATYAAGTTAVLTVLAGPRANVARMHLEGRRAGTRIGELVDGPRTPPPPTGA